MLTVAVAAALLAVSATLLSGAEALVERRRVAAAADAAALAAADTAAGLVGGMPCDVARRAAELHGAQLASCGVDGLIAHVAASGSAFGVPVVVRARAGPPPGDTGSAVSRTPPP